MSLPTDLRTSHPQRLDATCALLARTHQAQLAGTAPVATGWLLLDQPGAWGRNALTSSALEPALGAHLDDLAGDDVRVQLVRRPGSHPAALPTPRTVILAHSGPAPWAERLELESDAELWELEPDLTLASEPPGIGTAVDGPLWLVCTHGKRDRCCAEHGRPIVDALAAEHGDAVWEVSHIGGHRFAGNVLSLPGGEVYGLLDVGAAQRTAALHQAGRYDLAHLRGRSGVARPTQAAEVLARTELAVDGRDAVEVLGSQPGATSGATEVRLRVSGAAYRVTVRSEPTGTRYLQSCDQDEPADPGRFVLVDLVRT